MLFHPDPAAARKLSVWHMPLLCVQWITPDDGQKNCPKHVEFHFQNKFEKSVHLVGFIIRKFVTMHGHMSRCKVTCHDAGHMSRFKVTCHDARSHVTMQDHMSRCTVTCHDARSHVTMHGHMSRCKVTCHDSRSHERKIHTFTLLFLNKYNFLITLYVPVSTCDCHCILCNSNKFFHCLCSALMEKHDLCRSVIPSNCTWYYCTAQVLYFFIALSSLEDYAKMSESLTFRRTRGIESAL
jgi:hypothetical protein